MDKAQQYTFAKLKLTLYAGDKDKDSIHLLCNGYDELDERGKKLFQEVADLLTDAIEFCTRKQAAAFESPYKKISRFDISTPMAHTNADVLYAVAMETMQKAKDLANRAKLTLSAIGKLRKILRNTDKHERNTIVRILHGSIQGVFTAFHTARAQAEHDLPDEATTAIQKSIDKKLNDTLRDKLIYTVLLDYYLGDKVLGAIIEHKQKKPGEDVDTFVSRTAVAANKGLQKKIDDLLVEENVGKKAPKIRKYLAGELAEAIETTIRDIQTAKDGKRTGKSRIKI